MDGKEKGRFRREGLVRIPFGRGKSDGREGKGRFRWEGLVRIPKGRWLDEKAVVLA